MLPLLKEYTGKLNDFSGNGHRKAGTKVPAPLQQYLIIAKRFAQFVSQRLATAHDDFLTIELQLRLAEYEAALATAELQLR